METVQEIQSTRKAQFTERFQTVLPRMVLVLEEEWRGQRPCLTPEQRRLFSDAHKGLAGLLEEVDR